MNDSNPDTNQNTPTEDASPQPHRHEHHRSVISRLARIEGHVRAIKRMVEEDTPCPDILVQVAAVRALHPDATRSAPARGRTTAARCRRALWRC